MDGIHTIQHRIYDVRGQRVMLDRDLAALYGVETRVLNQAVRRNAARFDGDDFMFQLTKDELRHCTATVDSLRSQIVISNDATADASVDTCDSLRSQIVTSKRGGARYLPYAFTELGVAMLSSVLRSEIAIQVNSEIMRAFVTMRHMALRPMPDTSDELRKEIQALRDEMNDILSVQNDINEDTRAQLGAISMALAELQAGGNKPRPTKRIGFI